MQFDYETVFAAVVFAGANLYLGFQLLRLFWPLKMVRFSKKDAISPEMAEGLKTLAETDKRVRRAVPIGKTIAILHRGELSESEMRFRKFWFRSWFYTIASLLFFYTQPSIFGTGADTGAFSIAIVLTESLCAYAQALLVQSVADFRRHLIDRYLKEKAQAQLATASGQEKSSLQ